MIVKARPLTVAVALTTLLLSVAAFAIEPIYTTIFGSKAIRGYDPVAYFTEAAPVKGSSDYTFEWQGARWFFSSADNRDRFAADPLKWAPAYGGWCAYAMAKGQAASTDPDAFTIHDNRLYLNYSLGVRRQWLEDRDNYIGRADVNYPRLVTED